MSFDLTYKDPSKKNLQRVEFALLIILLPFGIYSGASAIGQITTFQKAERLMMEGERLTHQGKQLEARKLFTQAVELQPDYYGAWQLLCTSLHGEGLYKEELEAYRRALKELPDNPALLRDASVCFHKNELYEEEYKALERASSMMPDDALCQSLWRRAQKRKEAGDKVP